MRASAQIISFARFPWKLVERATVDHGAQHVVHVVRHR
jgi:hypothetical protein